MTNKMSETDILMMFGKDDLYEVPDAEKEENADWFDYFRQMLLEYSDNVSDYDPSFAGLHVIFAEHAVPNYGKTLKLDLLTPDLEALRAGEGSLYFRWPEDFCDFLQQMGVELSSVWQKEGLNEK